MTSLSALWDALKRDRGILERVTLSVLTMLVALVLGGAARRRLDPMQRQVRDLRNAMQTISVFQSSYRPLSPEQESRLAHVADSLDLGSPAGMRLPVAEAVTRVAELAGLRQVRVRFAAPDSAFIPPRGAGDAAHLTPAGYVVALDGDGAFADVVRALNTLPRFVSVVRLTATNERAAVHYHIVLAVYETADVHRPT